MTTPAPLLDVQDLEVAFATARGVARVLRGVSLTVPRGRIVGVVGESGSGKSTLAAAVLRLLPANLHRLSGRILLDGEDLLALPEPAMRRVRGRRVAMIFQDPMTALNPVFRIGTQLVDAQRAAFPDRSRREALERAVAMLARVGIPDAARRVRDYPHTFSGGMRQRIMIAMALLAEPDLLIADEPTTALDVTVEAQILRLLEQVRADFDGSILFISHGLGVVSALCDEVVALYAGTVVERAPARAFFTRPRHPYAQALLACEIADDDRRAPLRTIAGEVPDAVGVPDACIFAARCPAVETRCRRGVPPLRPLAPRHDAACVLA